MLSTFRFEFEINQQATVGVGRNVIRVAICESLISGTRSQGRKSLAIYPNHYGYVKSRVGGNTLGAAPLDSLLIFYIMTCVALYRGTTYSGNPAFASLRGLSPKESKPVWKIDYKQRCCPDIHVEVQKSPLFLNPRNGFSRFDRGTKALSHRFSPLRDIFHT